MAYRIKGVSKRVALIKIQLAWCFCTLSRKRNGDKSLIGQKVSSESDISIEN